MCGKTSRTHPVIFEENVSYFLKRRERKISGNLCWSCIEKTYKTFQLNTLVGTWWGAIGCWVGPPHAHSQFAAIQTSAGSFKGQGLRPQVALDKEDNNKP
jgi:hypothetical protein